MPRPEATPGELGYRFPAEWLPHRATWVAWPSNRETWPHNLSEAQNEFVRFVETVAKGETVCLIASDDALHEARARLAHVKNIEYFDIPTNDAWIRDYGPTFVINPQTRKLAAVDWRYNGWGEKYPPFDDDANAAKRIAAATETPVFSSECVVEGGALEINSTGDLITTISCLLNFNRNPIPDCRSPNEEISAARFEAHQSAVSETLARFCGAASIHWLSGAEIAGDDTDGHIDQQLRFAADDLVLLARGYGPDDPQQSELDRNLAELKTTFSDQARTLQGMDVPLPRPIHFQDQRLPASYLNFYICNFAVVVPQFGDTLADVRAVDIMKSVFADRSVVGLPSLNLASGLGSFHCLSQQEPLI